MRRGTVILGFIFVLGAFSLASAAEKCDRACLVAIMDGYLDALVKHDPSMVPLAANVKLVENTRRIAVGKGLWATASAGPKDFKIHIADPEAGQVGFVGVIHAKNEPAILGARLKLVDRKITEIDHLVVLKSVDHITENFVKPRPGFLQRLEPSEKVPRQQMLKAANSYYDAIVNVSGKLAPFAPECQRRENGIITANQQIQTAEDAAKDDFAVFRKMT
jgi:hypothetical protein